MYSVSSIAWKFDGSRLALGTVTGAVDLYDACIRRYRYKGKFEFTYVSLSQAIRARAQAQPEPFVRRCAAAGQRGGLPRRDGLSFVRQFS
jgi:intraflagellar transport protein 172